MSPQLRLYFLTVFLCSTLGAYCQLTFTFTRNYIGEETYCTELKEEDPELENVLQSDLARFDEERNLNSYANDVFRIVTYGEPGDLKDIIIRKIEKKDSTCVVSIKYLKNFRRKEVLVHSKVYDLSKWNEFQSLAKRYFWQSSQYSEVKIARAGELGLQYEILDSGKYELISTVDLSSDTMWLYDYLDYLVSPIFDDKCKGRRR